MSGLGKFTFKSIDAMFIGLVVEGFLYGLYSAIFCMYIQYHASKELGSIQVDKRNVLLYLICILYILSTAAVVLNIVIIMISEVLLSNPGSLLLQPLHLSYVLNTINGLSDFISQAILIYRCWVAWGCNIRVIIIPSILAFGFLATWLAVNGSILLASDPKEPLIRITHWGYPAALTSVVISLTVNAVVTSLIVLRILKVYWEVRSTFEGQTLGVGGAEAKVRSMIFIMIESGMAIFTIQLVRLVLLTIRSFDALVVIININEMFNGLTATIILLRVSMGLSYHNEKSFVETAASWRFAPQNQDPIPETGGIKTESRERLNRICSQ